MPIKAPKKPVQRQEVVWATPIAPPHEEPAVEAPEGQETPFLEEGEEFQGGSYEDWEGWCGYLDGSNAEAYEVGPHHPDVVAMLEHLKSI